MITIREKVHFTETIHQVTEGSEMLTSGKVVAQCAISKKKMETYTETDFMRIATGGGDGPKLVRDRTRFRTHAFQLYQARFYRREPTIASRKKYTMPNGLSAPFRYYRLKKNDVDHLDDNNDNDDDDDDVVEVPRV